VDWASQRSYPVVASDASADEPPDTKELLTVLLENLVVAQLAEKLSFFYGSCKIITVFTGERDGVVFGHIVVHLSTSCLHAAAAPVRPVSWRMKQKLPYFTEKKSVPTTSSAQDCDCAPAIFHTLISRLHLQTERDRILQNPSITIRRYIAYRVNESS
jgi:hypothetical protein